MVDDIRRALQELRIPCTIIDITEGPHVVAYKLKPGYTPYASKNTPPKRVKVGSIINSARDIGIAIGSPTYIRYNGNDVWLEVSKEKREIVSYNDVAIPDDYKFPIPIGLDARGDPVVIDLANPVSPHALIAGATGSGKSVCINSIIYGLIKRLPPSKLKLLMIDPKRVELAKFKNLEHLIEPIVMDADDASRSLRRLINEMEETYIYMEQNQITDISMAWWKERNVIIVDEYADLVAANESIARYIAILAQKGRAAGYHIILATQRPSVDVIDGVIKGNFPTRIAFSVVTGTDSRVILDRNGAERLTGMGDGLLLRGGKLTRFQGIYVDDGSIYALLGEEKKTITTRPSELVEDITIKMDENGRTIGLIYTPPEIEGQPEREKSPVWALILVFIFIMVLVILASS